MSKGLYFSFDDSRKSDDRVNQLFERGRGHLNDIVVIKQRKRQKNDCDKTNETDQDRASSVARWGVLYHSVGYFKIRRLFIGFNEGFTEVCRGFGVHLTENFSGLFFFDFS